MKLQLAVCQYESMSYVSGSICHLTHFLKNRSYDISEILHEVRGY